MFSLPRRSVTTLGQFHSSIPSELLIRFAFLLSVKKAQDEKVIQAKNARNRRWRRRR